ncbi:MAG: hypothetical protein ACW963_09690 [Candidatus Sifarchaeia archaeon]|jgi:hypothetical protein
MKVQKQPGWPNFLFPTPVVLVTCLDEEKGGTNIITLAWSLKETFTRIRFLWSDFWKKSR